MRSGDDGPDKGAAVKRFHSDSHGQLRTHLADFLAAYNFARRLKTLNGLTPYEYICKVWTSEPDRLILDPIRQMPGLNSGAQRPLRDDAWHDWFAHDPVECPSTARRKVD